MSEIESLERLRDAMAARASEPYLLSVTDANRPHCGAVTVRWDAAGARLLVQAPSKWQRSRASGHLDVSLLWPPSEPGGYSLIVDGAAAGAPDEAQLAITPTRAVLHRRGPAPTDSSSSCGSDCVPLFNG